MEERKLKIKAARGEMNKLGGTMIVYYLIMNTAVSIVMLADACIYLIGALIKGTPLGINDIINRILDFATSNGWGYILAIAAEVVILLIWKGKGFFGEMFIRQKRMTPGVFAAILCVFLLPQALLQVYAPALEWVLNQMGLSAMAALEMATIQTDTVSMFLYVAFLGPVAEELLCRGLLLRMLRPWGKQAAIVVSAIAFGLLHGNIIQIPFAFLVGLVLGYVTVEYSIIWAMVLHIINNFVLSDLIARLEKIAPELASVLFWGILVAAAIASVVLLIVKREEVKDFFRNNKVEAVTWRGLLSSAAMWIFAAMMLLSSLLTVTRI